MVRRFGRFGLPGLLALAGAAVAKPPGPPESPLVEGREPPPIVREHYELAAIRTDVLNDIPAPGENSTAAPFAEWIDWLKSVVEHGFTVPLGTVEVPTGE